ncbi:hypothetical protein GJV76_02135 [Myroides sp. BIT-d1]|uniref:Tetratricopeptide repeat protein n=1 Tax=Myroides albus TaxID=2562892 RepID=A0A6I3LLA4_9FLAO|nr:hypothetical protein [Myroides albus]MTG96952.1 hypothetical protein [Myroides albus]
MVLNRTISILQRTSVLFALMFFVFGCASYHDRITDYYKKVGAGDYVEAEKSLDKNALVKKDRNKLLYLMEKGRLAHLQGEYAKSNNYLNEADLLVEDAVKSVGDVAVGLFLNSMSQSYKSEEFEIFMLHYYKALNYLFLGETQEAVVEARRISLQNYAQGDKYKDKTTRYSKDAFSLILQGLIYEHAKNYNDAFIAYRNAVEVFKSAQGSYYGVSTPRALKMDLLRMAYNLGFTGELNAYQKEFNLKYNPKEESEGGDLVIFWENGMAPIKTEENIVFTLVKGEKGGLFFTNALGIMIPVSLNISGGTTLNDVHSLNIAYPKYIVQQPPYFKALAKSNDYNYSFELVEDIDALAVMTLKERAGKELGDILTRMAVKKAAEYALKAAAKSNGKDGEANAVLEGIGFGVQLFNMFSEKADTRNWQTLPAKVNYTRIPLKKGENVINVEMERPTGQRSTYSITVYGTGGVQFHNFATMR